MLGLSPRDATLVALLALSILAFMASARWARRLAAGRALITYSIGFSLGFSLLALLTGLVVLRDSA